MTRESLKDLALTEIQSAMEADLVQFGEVVENTEFEKLPDLESDLMKEFKEYDEYIKNQSYPAQDSVEYDGTVYKAGQIREKIISFLNRLEVEFRATLGILQAIRFWKEMNGDSIPYPVYDSTVRLLGTLKFKGEQDCLDVLLINNYFAPTHSEYAKDTTWVQFLTAKHQLILDSMEKRNPAKEEAVAE